MTIIIKDEFLGDFDAVRDRVLAEGNFEPHQFGGHTYEGVSLVPVLDDSVRHLIEDAVGASIYLAGAFWRRAGEGDPNPTLIHTDNAAETHAFVLYMSDPVSDLDGTAFWRHRATDSYAIPPHPRARAIELVAAVVPDGNDETRWDMTLLARAKSNRFISFPSQYYHSRYPLLCEGYGQDLKNSRLILAGFFSLI